MLGESPDDGRVGDDVGSEFAALDVEDEDEDGDAGEDVGALVGEVVLDEAILSVDLSATKFFGIVTKHRGLDEVKSYINIPSAVPEIQHQVPHELDIAMLDIDRSAQSAHILGYVVAEDDAAHGRLPRAALPHEQHLALLLPLGGVHAGVVPLFSAISIPR